MRIAGYEVAYTGSFICQEGQDVEFDVVVGVLPVTFVVRFSHEPEQPPGRLAWRSEGNQLRLTFSNWRHKLGAALVQPVRLGDVAGLPLFVQAAVHRIGEVDLVHFQVMTGGE